MSEIVKTEQPDSRDRLHDKAVEGLIRRVRGFTSREVKVTYERDPQGERVIKNEVVTRRQNPPDLQSIVFTLTNLDPGRWRAKPDTGVVARTETAPEEAEVAAMGSDALRLLAENFPKQ